MAPSGTLGKRGTNVSTVAANDGFCADFGCAADKELEGLDSCLTCLGKSRGWVAFIPPVATAGWYAAVLNVPADEAICTPRAADVPIVVSHSSPITDHTTAVRVSTAGGATGAAVALCPFYFGAGSSGLSGPEWSCYSTPRLHFSLLEVILWRRQHRSWC